MIAPVFIRSKILVAAAPLLCLALGMQAQQTRVTGPQPMNWEAAGDCPGDVNLDGARDLLDVVRLIRHITNAQALTGDDLANADIDKNGTINNQDTARLRRHIVGLEPLADCAPSGIPRINSISPQRILAGASLTITGANFSPTASANTVSIWGTNAAVVSASATQLVVTVPSFSRGGLVIVNVTVGGKTSSDRQIVIDRFEPRISIQPLATLAGSAPPISILMGMDSGDLPLDRLLINFPGFSLDTAGLQTPAAFGRAYATAYLFGSSGSTAPAIFLVTSVNGVNLDVQLETNDGTQTAKPIQGQVLPGASGVVLDLRFGKSSRGLNDRQTLAYSGDFVLYLNPGRLVVPRAQAQPLAITSTAYPSLPPGASAPSKEFKTEFRPADPGAGAPTIRSIIPFDPSFRQEVDIGGSDFSSTPGENVVTFAGLTGIRVSAPVQSANSSLITVTVPAGAANGPVRVERRGQSSNDFSVWMAFAPSLNWTLRSLAAGAASGLTVNLTESQAQLATQTFRTLANRGSWNWATLIKNAKIGTFSGEVGLFGGYMDLFVLDTDGTKSATIIFKDRSGELNQDAQILLTNEDSDGAGMYFLLLNMNDAGTPSIRLRGTSATLNFDEAVFRNPASGPLAITSWLSSTPSQPGFQRPLRGALMQTLTIQ